MCTTIKIFCRFGKSLSTDMNLLWDAGRKSLDMIEDAIEEGLLEWKRMAQREILEERVEKADEDQRKGVKWRGEK